MDDVMQIEEKNPLARTILTGAFYDYQILRKKLAIPQINRMLRKSFGAGTRGDYGKSKDEVPFYSCGYDGRLSFIVRRKILNDSSNHKFSYEEIGRFDSQDGSILTVKKEYFERSKKYSELYFRKTEVLPKIKMLTGEVKYIPFRNEGG